MNIVKNSLVVQRLDSGICMNHAEDKIVGTNVIFCDISDGDHSPSSEQLGHEFKLY